MKQAVLALGFEEGAKQMEIMKASDGQEIYVSKWLPKAEDVYKRQRPRTAR